MREILFRGKCKRGYDYSDGDGWVYGGIVTDGKEYGIVKHEYVEFATNCDDANDWGFIPVEKETVGQFTGLTDCNGKKIFEGDILVDRYTDEEDIERCDYYEVEFLDGVFGIVIKYRKVDFRHTPICDYFKNEELEVVGNIHDNPELLKGGTQ